MAKNKFYVVWNGRRTGVFSSWAACQEQIYEFKAARYKSFPDRHTAEQAFLAGPPRAGSKSIEKSQAKTKSEKPIHEALAVDAACSGNPGDMEYRGVLSPSGVEVFRSKVYKMGTNNVGEFLAIVHGLAWLKQQNSSMTIYSDSENAMKWVKGGKARTKLVATAQNAPLFELIQRAETWLQNNKIQVPLRKWETKDWGEVPADFGRK